MRTLLGKIFLLLGSLFFTLLLGEGLIRIVFPQQLVRPESLTWRSDPVFGRRHKENVRMKVNTGERWVRFWTDENGFRISQPSKKRVRNAPANIRIVSIGDSMIEGLQVENEQTIPGVLGRMLSEGHGLAVLSVNGGVGGWSPHQYYLEARRILERERYDLGLIFLYVGNDIITDLNPRLDPLFFPLPRSFSLPKSFAFGEIRKAVLLPLNNFLRARSHLFIFIKNRSEFLLFKLGLRESRFPDMFLIQYGEKKWDIVAEVCKKIRQEFERRKIPVLFVLLPKRPQVYEKLFPAYLRAHGIRAESADIDQPNRLLAASFSDGSLSLVDLLPHLRKKADEGIQMFGSIDHHFNVEGHHIIAEALLPFVEEALSPILKRQRDNSDLTS